MHDLDLGLREAEAKEKLSQYGRNKLPEKPPVSDFKILLSQLRSPLVYVLLVAGLVTFFLGHIPDTLIIGFAVVVNTILGFFQESKASHALTALKGLIHPTARVIRDGKLININAEEIVPEDVVVLRSGDKIPADGKLIEANRLFISEAILTGESVPASKEKNGEAFMGTIVVGGQAKMLVVKTGAETQVGKIATEIQTKEEKTPLQKQLSIFSRQLSILVLLLTSFVLVIGVLSGKETVEIFTTSVALAVSAIPEGLLVGLTVVLAIGMQRILAKKGLVRNLVSAETLGGVTVICADKTGTLTKGKMQVVEYHGDENALALQATVANDLDEPMVIAAYEWAKERSGENLNKKYRRIDSIPFSSEDRFFASLNKWSQKENMLFVNGAPEFLIKWCGLGKNEAKEFKEEINSLTKEGKRVIGFARKRVSSLKKGISNQDVTKGLDWVGVLALSDPIRGDVKGALDQTALAGIKTIVITGDYPETAISVLKNLGIKINKNEVILGEVLEDMPEEKLSSLLSSSNYPKLFARTTPHQKLKIVSALKKNGEVVAMMGDGVNDAPAIKKADIGIVVADASDVAKETSDLVLLNSSFETIVSAIKGGRIIFNNIRKIVLYLMSDAFEEIIAVVISLVLGLPTPVTAAQILWINLVSDGFPHLALSVDPGDGEVMKENPRSPEEKIVNAWVRKLIFIVSATGGLVGVSFFIYFYNSTKDITLARSIAFATLGINSLVYVFSVRTLNKPFWKENPFKNYWLNLAVLVGLFLQIAPFFFEKTRTFLSLATLSLEHWVLIFVASLIMFIIIEVTKVFVKK